MKKQTKIIGLILLILAGSYYFGIFDSLLDVEPPVKIDVYGSARYVKQFPANVTTIYPAHWLDCVTKHVGSGVRSDGTSYGAWYQMCEGIPIGEVEANVGDGSTMLVRTNDDYTSPIILIHDGCQGYNKQWCDSYIVAVMQMDGCGKADIYWDCNGEKINLWEGVTSCDANKVQQGFKPIAKLVDKTTCQINTFDISGTPFGSVSQPTSVELSDS